MRSRRGQSGFTLMEVLVVLATILMLIGALVGLGRYIRTRANIDLTKGMLETLCTALTQYYDGFGNFPFDTDTDGDGVLDDYLEANLQSDLGGTVSPAGSLTEPDGRTPPVSVPTASSAALFYFLDKDPASRAIASAVSNTLITNKNAAGLPITITIGTNPAIDLPRYIDSWGMSIRYEYLNGTAFPTLISAGPDKIFDTPDDITSK